MAIELPLEQDRPSVPIAPPLLFVLPVFALLALEWFWPTSLLHGLGRWIIGFTILFAGLALSIAGFVTQKRAGTDPIPFNPSTLIVSHGLYRFTRNPMYVGFAVATIGFAILINSAWVLLAAPVGLILTHRLVVAREERYLERKFGDEYLAYKGHVRRWL